MRILSFRQEGTATFGVQRGEDIIDLARAARELPNLLEEVITVAPGHEGEPVALAGKKFMHDADACEVKIEDIGSLVNPVLQEKTNGICLR